MAEINSGAPVRPPPPPPPPPAAPTGPAGAPGSAPSAQRSQQPPAAPAALRDAFQQSPLRQFQRNQGDSFTPSSPPGQRPAAQGQQPAQAQQQPAQPQQPQRPEQAPQPRPAGQAQQAPQPRPVAQRSAAESVPANRNDHVQQQFQRLRTARETEAGRPLNQTEQADLRRQAEQVADRERTDAANKVRTEMLDRARTSTSRIAGQSPEGLVRRAITENPNITNEQILGMARLRPEQVASSPEAQRRTLERIPNARELPSHQFTVDMLHAVTGIDRNTLSRNGPDLGITGSAERPIIFRAPPNDRERLSTSLHDLTDTMRSAGVPGVNQAVWGNENQVRSAWNSLDGVPPRFLDRTTLNQGDETVRPRR